MSKDRQIWPENDAQDQAAYWMTILQSEDCTEVDQKAFELWKQADPENKAAFRALLQVWKACDELTGDADFIALRRRALTPGAAAPRRKPVYAAAAVFVMGFALSALFALNAVKSPSPSLPLSPDVLTAQAEPDAAKPLHLSTAIGERSIVNLEDGSTVDLNTDTEIRVRFTETERRLYLLRGQAVFNVAHNKERPFVVYAGTRRVIALGTEFEVKFDQVNPAAVTLVTGSVQVEDWQIEDSVAVPVIKRTVQLAPGQRLDDRDDTPVSVSEDYLERALSWREGRLVFENGAVQNMVNEMNRYSNRKIVFADDSISQIRFGGTFKAGSSYEFAKAFANLHGLEMRVDNTAQNIVIDWK